MYGLALLLLALGHFLVDGFALSLQPLWPDLQQSAALDEIGFQLVFVLWSVSTSLSQIFFAYWGDRRSGGYVVWLGPAVAVACLSLVGLASNPLTLALLVCVGGLGVGAFHPEAAAMVGACAPQNRARAMSIFVLGGSLGQAAGPLYSGYVTTAYGLPALSDGIVWGMAFVLVLAVVLRRAPGPSARAVHSNVSLAKLVRGRRKTLALMLGVAVLRVIPILGVLLGLAYMLKARGMTNAAVGQAQSVMEVSMGGGVLLCALFVRRSSERLVLWLAPLFAVPALLFAPSLGYSGLLVCLAVAGASLGGATPVLISYGQQLLPEGQRVASSLTMGVSWGLGGAIVAAIITALNRVNAAGLSLSLFAVAPLLSSLLCIWLPRIDLAEAPEPALARPA